MFATLVVFSMDPSKRAAQLKGLNEMVIPTVKRQPGFVQGFWSLDTATPNSYGYIVWEDEGSARRFQEVVRGNGDTRSEVGVTFVSFAVAEVIGRA